MKELTVDEKPTTNAFVRLFFMIMLYLMFIIARTLIIVVTVFQFFAHLFTGRPTDRGARWGQGLSNWIHQMMLFMTYNTEAMPFPFSRLGPQRD